MSDGLRVPFALQILCASICLVASVGCGGGTTQKLAPNPEVDYQALEQTASDEEDLSGVNTRALEGN